MNDERTSTKQINNANSQRIPEMRDILNKGTILFLLVLLCSCTPIISSSSTSSNRSEIVSWAIELSTLEKKAKLLVDGIQPLMLTIVKRPPTASELSQLNDYSNNITDLYNQIIGMNVPKEARDIHSKYVDNYGKIADSARYYVLAIRENNVDYFNKSVASAQEANRIGTDAYYDFTDLLEKYSITCTEINYCE